MLETNEYTIETVEDFMVAGVAKRDTDIDATGLWAALGDYVGDLEDALSDESYDDTVADEEYDDTVAHERYGISDERYGVIFELDEGSEEFTYVVGYAVESTHGIPAEMTVVDIPEASYAVFSLRGVDLNEMVYEINEGLLSDTEHEELDGPIFQRYAPGEDPADPGASFELFVPVEDE